MTLKLNNIKVLHLEPTDACNAACPQCARETNANFNKNNLHHLTVDQINSQISEEVIRGLDKMFMCGNYGDPAAGKHTLDIFRYFREINPSITLGMNSNGGLRSTSWWGELAGILNQPRDYVVFSIDGLVDTNHIYRINVDFNKVIVNAKSFIASGGSAHWDMLVFSHNEHQVDSAEQLAKEVGFSWFRAKVSKRFNTHPVSFLQPPKAWQDPVVTKGSIECSILKESSIYLSAQGQLYPCCWLGNTHHTLDQFDTIQQSWNTSSPNETCFQTCAKNTQGTSFTNQWQREVAF
jgi:hypothetical protein